MICPVSKDEVKSCKFRPEPHTVSLSADGEYWAYKVSGKIVSTLRIRRVRQRNVIEGVYTEPLYRGRGIMHLLLDHVVNDEYSGCDFYARCLASSKKIFSDCGFEHYHTVAYPHGTQYFMRREV